MSTHDTADVPITRPSDTLGGEPLRPVGLVDLLDRLLGAGVVISGVLVISLADVDLVQIRLHALITSIRAEMVQE